MDEELAQTKANENLRNPKNRFLGLFCHANEVDNSWGCDWSFATGVVLFSIICGFASLWDIYYIARDKFFERATYHTVYKIFFFFKLVSDLVCLIGIGMACFSINRDNHTYAIVSYYVMVLSFLLHSIYLIYTFIWDIYKKYQKDCGACSRGASIFRYDLYFTHYRKVG